MIDYPDETWGSKVARENRVRIQKLTPSELRELYFPSKGTAARRRWRRNKRKMRKIAKSIGDLWWNHFLSMQRFYSQRSSFYSFIQRQNESQKLSGQHFIRRRLFHDSAGCGQDLAGGEESGEAGDAKAGPILVSDVALPKSTVP